GGKKFEEVGTQAGVAYAPNGVALSGMGSDFRDVNNDGRPDIWYTAVERETFPLLMNQGNGEFDDVTQSSGLQATKDMSGWGNRWLLLKLVGTKSNRMGLGAQIHLTTQDGASQWNEATTAVGYTGSSDSRVHFGVGKNRVIKDVEIRWPSGIKQVLHDIAADQ